ncbi:MFS transporter [Microbacterium sp. No. 7]|uniref:MFS transporter n=1 Tax=Microbacterium sp. No. 7 TaxID=1714373 RepID=UPI0006ED1EF6|nr:MFS transporter [Microbacterium sp. No. 7]ALJ21353.1 MFS transporter [Microbacterium sp. No. 7]
MTGIPSPLPGAAPEASVARATIQRRTMIVLIVMQVIGTIGVGVAPSIGVLLAGQVTDSEAWAGLARTASTLGAAVFGLPLGTIAARYGRRVALSGGWWVAAAGSALLVAAAQWSLVIPLFIGLFLIGVGTAVSLQARFAATDLAEPQHRGRSLALVVWVGTLGTVIGPNLGIPGELVGGVTGLTVFAAAFLIAAVCLALAGVIVSVWLRPDPLLTLAAAQEVAAPRSDAATRNAPADKTRRRGGRIGAVLTEMRTNRAARYALIAIVTAQIVMVAIMTMTPVHIEHQGGSVTIVGVTISLHIIGMYALAPLVGWIADRFGHRVTIATGILIFLASLLIGAIRPDGIPWIIASLILLGVGWSFVNVAGSALFSAAVTDEARASSQGGADALSNLLGATAAFAAGPLLAASSFSVLSVAAIAALTPLAILTAWRRPPAG